MASHDNQFSITLNEESARGLLSFAHASVALLANGLSDQRPNDSLGLGIYHNGISQPLKDDIARLTGATVTLKNENGLEVFYDFAITPAIRVAF